MAQKIKGLPRGAILQTNKEHTYVVYSYSFRRDGKPVTERDYLGSVVDGKFKPNAYYLLNRPVKTRRPPERWKDPKQRQLAVEREAKLARTRSKPKTVTPDNMDLSPGDACDKCVGVTAFAMKILYANGLVKDAGKCLDNDVSKTVHVLNTSLHQAVTAKANYLGKAEAEIQKFIGSQFLSSPRQSELLQEIGSNRNLSTRFGKARVERLKYGQLLGLDGTRIPCYSEQIGAAAVGKAKDGNFAKQINLSALVNLGTGEVLGYRWFPGNTNDISTMKDFRAIWKDIGIPEKRPMLVFDRGYYSQAEMQALDEDGLAYLVGTKMHTKAVKSFIDNENHHFYSALSLVPNYRLYGRSCQTEILTHKAWIYAFRDPNTEMSETNDLFKELDRAETRWMSGELTAEDPILKYFKNPIPGKKLERDLFAIEQDCYLKGYFAFTSNVEMSTLDAIERYSLRNEVEVVFGLMFKHLMRTAKKHSTPALEGALFTTTIALSILTDLRARMKRTLSATGKQIRQTYTIAELFKELQQITLVKDEYGVPRLVGLNSKHKQLIADLGFEGLFDDPFEVERLLTVAKVQEELSEL